MNPFWPQPPLDPRGRRRQECRAGVVGSRTATIPAAAQTTGHGYGHSVYPLAATWLVLSASGAMAQPTNALVLHTDFPDVGQSLIRLLAALAVVLALFFAGVWLFRNGQRLAWRKTGMPRLSVVESRALGNRFAIYVVGYDRQRFLVGSSPAGLALLSPLPAAEPVDPTPVAEQRPGSFAKKFQSMLEPGVGAREAK